jgi:hypothetical protein
MKKHGLPRDVRALAAAGVLASAVALAGSVASGAVKTGATVADGTPSADVQHDTSPPLRNIPPALGAEPGEKREHPLHNIHTPPSNGATDTVIQSGPGGGAAPSAGVGFEGLGLGFSGPQGTFNMQWAPPDTNAAVGPNHIFEIVNTGIAVFNKSGGVLYGPVPTNTLWSGFGGGCQTNDDGDGTVVYDRISDRWIVQQFSVSTTPYLECVAVSTTGDPTGSYYRYSFNMGSEFPDYPKLGVWPDAYYATFNLFRNGASFDGPEVCAYDRAKMLSGQAATQQCVQLSTSYGSLLPSDLDGSTPPPSGSPNFLLSYGTNSLLLWKFHVDWANTANTALTGPTTISVAGFSAACGGGTCIPQAGTTQRLDSLADRLMYRLAYRNFGSRESLVVTQSVTAGTSTGIRWYELQSPNGTPTVHQQGTYAPDGNYRWMGSAAMDKNGDIALGYSVSSSTVNPSIRYTGRLAGDPLGTMTQGEGTLVNGTGSQTGGLSRWGDYSSMQIDPADDCTFWYTTEYLASNGNWNWHTRIGSFTLPGCGSGGGGGAPTSVSNSAATNVAPTTVTMNGSANPNGLTTSGFFRYWTSNPGACSTASGGTPTSSTGLGGGTTTVNFSVNVTGLNTGTTYYYCAFANNSGGTTAAGNTATNFTTNSLGGAPTATTNGATSVGGTSATVNGSANPNGLSTTVGFRWGPSAASCAALPNATPTSTISGTTTQNFSSNLTGLKRSTTYFYCAVASNSGGNASGSVLSFTTKRGGK